MTTYDFATKTLGKYCDPGSLYRGFETRHFRHSYGRAAVSSTSCLRGPARRPHISGLLVRSLDSGPEVVTPFSHGLLWPIRRLTVPLPQNVMSATGPTQASVISPAYVLFQPDRNVHMSELRVLLFQLYPRTRPLPGLSSSTMGPSYFRLSPMWWPCQYQPIPSHWGFSLGSRSTMAVPCSMVLCMEGNRPGLH